MLSFFVALLLFFTEATKLPKPECEIMIRYLFSYFIKFIQSCKLQWHEYPLAQSKRRKRKKKFKKNDYKIYKINSLS